MGVKVGRAFDSNGKQEGWMFYCPGCQGAHMFELGRWAFDGNIERPTFSPSLLYPNRCHLYLREGKIQFLSDCAHPLVGQTVEIPDWLDGDWRDSELRKP